MPEVRRRRREEDGNIVRLPKASERRLTIFVRGEQPDDDVLVAAADDFASFPARCHHLKEDLVFRRLREGNPAAADSIGDLEAGYREIGRGVHRFREAVANVREDAEVPRSAFDAVSRHLNKSRRCHMEMKEKRFVLLATKLLSEEDWLELDVRATGEDDSPVGAEASGRFESLLRDILRWEREDEAAER